MFFTDLDPWISAAQNRAADVIESIVENGIVTGSVDCGNFRWFCRGNAELTEKILDGIRKLGNSQVEIATAGTIAGNAAIFLIKAACSLHINIQLVDSDFDLNG